MVREANRDPQASHPRVKEVSPETRVFPDWWARPDPKVQVELLVFLDHQVSRVLRDSKARPGFPGQKATEGLPDFRDIKATPVTKVSEVSKVNVVCRVQLGRRERKAPRAQRVCLDKKVQRAQEVTMGLQDLRVSEVLLGLLEMQELQDHPGFKDLQEYQGIQDNQEPKVIRVKQEESLMQLVPPLWVSQDHLGLLVLLALLDLQDCQVPLARLVCLANLVSKVTGDLRESVEKQE